MAREPSITQDQVAAAAERLSAAGEKPTARNVRAELGAGSMATVLKHLQAWQSTRRTSDVAPGFPPQLQKALLDFAVDRVSVVRASLEAEIANLEQANADLIQESDRQATAIEKLTAELDAMRGEKSELAGRVAQLSSDAESLRADSKKQLAELNAANTENARLSMKLESLAKLEVEVERLRSDIDDERSKRFAAEQAAAVAGARLEAAEARLRDLSARAP